MREHVSFIIALMLLLLCGAGIVWLYSESLSGSSTVEAGIGELDVSRCDRFLESTWKVAEAADVDACAARWASFSDECVQEPGTLVVVVTPDTRWAVREGLRPLRIVDDDELLLLRIWCTQEAPRE